MDFKERLEVALQLLEAKGLHKRVRRFNLYRLLYSCGLRVRPAYFNSFAVNVVTGTIQFALISGVIKWMLRSHADDRSLVSLVVEATITGVFISTWIAVLIRRAKRKHDLPDWDELQRPASVFD